MILFINTADKKELKVSLKNKEGILASKKISVDRTQAEKLLPAIEALLKSKKLSLKNISSIEVNNAGGSFTSLRIGVVTANALGYALGVPVKGVVGESKKVNDFHVVEPKYDSEPNIGTHNA